MPCIAEEDALVFNDAMRDYLDQYRVGVDTGVYWGNGCSCAIGGQGVTAVDCNCDPAECPVYGCEDNACQREVCSNDGGEWHSAGSTTIYFARTAVGAVLGRAIDLFSGVGFFRWANYDATDNHTRPTIFAAHFLTSTSSVIYFSWI